jgi:hypothetical protein
VRDVFFFGCDDGVANAVLRRLVVVINRRRRRQNQKKIQN